MAITLTVNRSVVSAVCLGFLLPTAASHAGISTIPGPSVESTAEADYQGLGPGLIVDASPGVAGGPPLFSNARSLQSVSGDVSGDGIAFDDADARARANLPGTLGAYARAGGFSPSTGPGSGTSATATARVVTNWRVNSADPTAPIDVAAFYDGFLYVSRNGGLGSSPNDVVARVDVELSYITPTSSTVVFAAGGNLSLQTETLTTSFSALDGSADTEWVDSWENDPLFLNGFDFKYDLDYFEFFEDLFDVATNEDFAFESKITVTADNDIGPFEIFATSDFFNTGDTDLTVNTPGATLLSLNPVPEPSALTLLALGGVAVMRRR